MPSLPQGLLMVDIKKGLLSFSKEMKPAEALMAGICSATE
jgi:hypothetical protein